MSLSAPPEFVLEHDDLRNAFRNIAEQVGLCPTEVDEAWSVVPDSVQAAPAFLCAMGRMWRYEFGAPIDRLPGGLEAIGVQQFPEVAWLVAGTHAIRRHLSDEAVSSIRSKLADRGRHQDALSELAPLSKIDDQTSASYEVGGQANRTIDWLFTPGAGVPVLLEVKRRIKDLVLHLGDSAEAAANGADEAPEPATDPEAFFRDTVEKFNPSDPSVQMQGVWVFTDIKQEKTALKEYFETLDPSRLHFALLADWNDDASVLHIDDPRKEALLSTFQLHESERFFFIGGES